MIKEITAIKVEFNRNESACVPGLVQDYAPSLLGRSSVGHGHVHVVVLQTTAVFQT